MIGGDFAPSISARIGAPSPAAHQHSQAEKAASAFEEIFLGELVSQMTQGTPLSDGPQGDMAQQAFVQAIAHSGGIGLSDSLASKFEAGIR